MKRDLHQQITDRILSTVDEAGNWKPCWRGMNATMPTNAVTKASYHGANVLSLWIDGAIKEFPTQQWASYKQWQSIGAQVRKGEQGSPIIFYKQVPGKTEDDTGYSLMRSSTVFNAAQVDGFEQEAVHHDNITPIERCEAYFAGAFNNAVIKHSDEGRAYFSPTQDFVMMPHITAFHAAEHYYSTLGHELVHWTGHKSRLAREFASRAFDKQTYAKEELVAEIGSAFITAALGIDHATRDDHASYIKSWLGALRNDKTLIVKAASLASKAVEYIEQLPAEQRQAA